MLHFVHPLHFAQSWKVFDYRNIVWRRKGVACVAGVGIGRKGKMERDWAERVSTLHSLFPSFAVFSLSLPSPTLFAPATQARRGGPLGTYELLKKWILCYSFCNFYVSAVKGRFSIILPRIFYLLIVVDGLRTPSPPPIFPSGWFGSHSWINPGP